MKRREFLLGASAMGVAPLVPFGVASGAAASVAKTAVAPSGMAGNFAPHMYGWAVEHVRSAQSVSPKMLTDFLGVQPDAARALVTRLVDKGVIGSPDALGVSRVLNPVSWNGTVSSVSVNRVSVSGVANSDPYRQAVEAIDDGVEKIAEQIDDAVETLERIPEEGDVPEQVASSEELELPIDDPAEAPLDEEVLQSDLRGDGADTT